MIITLVAATLSAVQPGPAALAAPAPVMDHGKMDHDKIDHANKDCCEDGCACCAKKNSAQPKA